VLLMAFPYITNLLTENTVLLYHFLSLPHIWCVDFKNPLSSDWQDIFIVLVLLWYLQGQTSLCIYLCSYSFCFTNFKSCPVFSSLPKCSFCC